MTTLKIPGLRNPLSLEPILWIEGDGNYSWIHFSARPKLLATQTLKWFADQLPLFIRVHKSSLVNLSHVKAFHRINSCEAKIILSNGTALLVARRRVQSIVDFLKKVGL